MKWHWLIAVAGFTACGSSGSSDVIAIEVDTVAAVRNEVSTTSYASTLPSTVVVPSTTTVTTSTQSQNIASLIPTPSSSPTFSSSLATTPSPTITSTTPVPIEPPPVAGEDSVPSSSSVVTTSSSTTIAVTTVAPPPPPTDPVGLRIESEYPSGYNRDLFRHWIDADGNGCDTRREVLIAESTTPVTIGSGCSITGGTWYSIYDNVTTTDSSSFDIDHVVALKEAWDSGAWNWTPAQRQAFANDLSQPFFLIAVSASSNRSKSDRDPADWLPTNTAYRCDYVRVWIDVKRAWNLSVDQVEHDALATQLSNC